MSKILRTLTWIHVIHEIQKKNISIDTQAIKMRGENKPCSKLDTEHIDTTRLSGTVLYI